MRYSARYVELAYERANDATPDLTLSKAIGICKSVEATTTQMKALKQEEMVYKLDKKHSPAASQSSRISGKITRKENEKGLSTPQT